MRSFGSGLAAMGLQPGDKVSLFSENSSRWLVADQGIMLNGAADAVSHGPALHMPTRCRGHVAMGNELQHGGSSVWTPITAHVWNPVFSI